MLRGACHTLLIYQAGIAPSMWRIELRFLEGYRLMAHTRSPIVNFAPADLTESLFTLQTKGATLSFGTLLTNLNTLMMLRRVAWLFFCAQFLLGLSCLILCTHRTFFRVFLNIFFLLQVLIKGKRFYFWLLKI